MDKVSDVRVAHAVGMVARRVWCREPEELGPDIRAALHAAFVAALADVVAGS